MTLHTGTLVARLAGAFQVLAKEGLIPTNRVDERARNQAQVVQMIVDEETADLRAELEQEKEYRRLEGEAHELQVGLCSLQENRADANAKAYSQAKEDITRLEEIIHNEQRKRRALDKENEGLIAQLKRAEHGKDAYTEGCKGAVRNLEQSLDMMVKAKDATNAERIELEDRLIAIVHGFETRPF